jgi:hypothetical protein
MNCQEFSEVLIDVYYGDASDSVSQASHEHQKSCKTCDESWQSIAGISQAYRVLSEEAPSQLSYNKILVYARERCERKNRPFWQAIWKPAASFALMAAFAVMSFVNFSAPTAQQVASNNGPVASPMVNLSELHNRVYNTAFDHSDYGGGNYQLNHYLNGGAQVTSVSQGFQGLEGLSVDEGLDQKMLSHNLDGHELETLYYRARKMEKLGNYRDAFNDYEFITKFYPNYTNSRFALIGMARCLQGLDQKDDALAVLGRYVNAYGPSDGVQDMIDGLKSETF